MSTGHEFVALAPLKMHHYGVNIDTYAPIAKYIKDHIIDLDFKICVPKSKYKHALSLEIPEDMLITRLSGINKYVFADYGPGYPENIENWYKTMYGHGDENKVYNQTIFWRMKNFKGWVCYSPYDCSKLAYNPLYFRKGKRLFYLNGSPKFDISNISTNNIKKLFDLPGFDIKKKTILVQSTWNKNQFEYAGYIDYDEMLINKLKELSKSYNVIHKYHHQDIKERQFIDGLINIGPGEVPSVVLYHYANIILCDYGGSALEALVTDDNTKLIYMNNPNLPKTNEIRQNLDIVVHKYLPSFTVEELVNNFDSIIDNYDKVYTENKYNKVKNDFRRLLYPYNRIPTLYSMTPTGNFVNIMLSLRDGTKCNTEFTKYDNLGDWDFQFSCKVGVAGHPEKVNNHQRYKDLGIESPKDKRNRIRKEKEEDDKNSVEEYND